jgi:CelD/BcsL family acetyltransferase involved in cellulose biosynthesis
MLTIDRIEHADGLANLREEWDALLADSAADCLFLTWEWLSCWWRHLSERRRLFVVTLRSGSELVGLAPLCRPLVAGVLPGRSLQFLGTGYVGSDYLDVIVRRGHERAVLPALAAYLAGTGLMLELAQVERRCGLAAELGRELVRRGWTLAEHAPQVCPFIDLRGRSWASYLAGLGTEHRYNVQRRLRNASRQFALTFEAARSDEQRRAALALLFRLHDLRFGECSDAFHTPALRAFHEDLSRAALAQGWLRLFALSLDGRPAAALYGFRDRRRFYFYQSGFDPAYGKSSVGLLAMALSIRHAIEEGADEYDLLHGDERYKFHWARQTRALSRLELYPPTLPEQVRRRTRDATRSARRLVRRLLPGRVVDGISAARRIGLRRALEATRSR